MIQSQLCTTITAFSHFTKRCHTRKQFADVTTIQYLQTSLILQNATTLANHCKPHNHGSRKTHSKMASNQEPIINSNTALQTYYGSLESRIEYRLVLGGTRHFGWYPTDTSSPFPISKSLRAMEDKIFEGLNLSPGKYVLDVGCGVGDVAIRMAEKGLHVYAIDVTEWHLNQAQKNVNAKGLNSSISVNRLD